MTLRPDWETKPWESLPGPFEYHPPYWASIEDVDQRSIEAGNAHAAADWLNGQVCIVCGWGGCKRIVCGRFDFRPWLHAYGFIRNYKEQYDRWLGEEVVAALRAKRYDVSVLGLEKYFKTRDIKYGSSTDAIVVDSLVTKFVEANP
jgi:hypothetical protein